MNATDVKCPACGTVNHKLNLEETGGWMECITCGLTVKALHETTKVSRNKENKESVVIRDTVLSLSLATFLLMGVCFMLKVFSIEYIHLLIWVICYLFFGIIYTIILWNYTLSKQ